MKSKDNSSKRRLNIIDYCVILVLVAVIALVAWKKFGGSGETAAPDEDTSVNFLAAATGGDPDGESTGTRTVRIQVLCSENPLASVQFLQASADKQIVYNGKALNAYITDIELLPSYISEGFASETRTDSLITIEAEAEFTSTGVFIDQQQIYVGAGFPVKTALVYLNGTVTNLEVLDD